MTNKELLKGIGERIRTLRKNNKLTQEKFGSKVNISQKYISIIENGKKENVSLEDLWNISKFFNVTFEYLLFGNENPILQLLEKYIVLEYDNLSITETTTYSYPKLRINKPFFDYLVKSANARKNNLMPDNVKEIWLNQEKENFNKSIKSNMSTEYEEFVPVPQELIYPDDDKENWNQADLIRKIDIKWNNRH